MATSKIQDISLAQLTTSGSFLGVRDNGDGTYTDIRISAIELVNFVRNSSRKTITVITDNIGAGGTTFTDAFFSEPLTEITTNAQSYIAEVDFSQSGAVVTGINFQFYDGQKIIAKK